MGEGWVIFGYVVTYGTIAAYLVSIIARTRSLERRRRP